MASFRKKLSKSINESIVELIKATFKEEFQTQLQDISKIISNNLLPQSRKLER